MRITSNILLLLFALNCFSQDSITLKVPIGQASGMSKAVTDTGAVPGFTEKVKALITWGNTAGKPSTYTPSSHGHAISDVTGLQAALDAKGTSNFDGAYNSLSAKPTTVAGYGITDAPKIVAAVNATAQAANIGVTTLYAVPSAGFYRVSIYITVTQAATTSSTMPSTTITYTDGNSGTNNHSTTTTATNTGNSLTTSFAQTTYVLYAKSGTNITYNTGAYASSGGTPMQYGLRIRVEAL